MSTQLICVQFTLCALFFSQIVKGEELSIADIRNMYPPDTIEEQEYFEWCGHAFKEEWYFDTQYCKFAPLEEYQRIALPHPVRDT